MEADLNEKQNEKTKSNEKSRMPSKLCVRVRFNDEIKCLEMDWDKINSEHFTESLISQFNVSINTELDPVLVLTDNLSMPVSQKQFENVVKTFHSGSMFYLNAELQPTSIKGAIQMVTPMMLENFFVLKAKGVLLLSRTSKVLNEDTVHLISNTLADFMIDAYGFDGITPGRKKMVASAAVLLFDALKFKDSSGDGTEKLLSSGSQFDNRLKYLIKRNRQQLAKEADKRNSVVIDDASPSPEADLTFLKESVISDVSLDIIKQKLNNTRALRKDKMNDLQFDIRESLPFLLSHPFMITLDYELGNPDIDSGALISKWPVYSQRLREICDREKKKYWFPSVWSTDVEDLLRLMKIFPAKNKSCDKLFQDAVEKFISFCVIGTPPEKMLKSGLRHPYIITCGFNPREITSFFIVVEQHVIPLPKEFGVADVLDMYFKLHIVFQLNYDANLVNMMLFLECLVYKITKGKKVHKPTAHMLQIFDELNA